MDITGPIFAIIALAWLAYLVPMILRRRQEAVPEASSEEPFSDDVHLVRSSIPDEDIVNEDLVVSTPLTRRAQLAGLARAERVAASRRRMVLSFLGLTLLSLVLTSAVGQTPWWSVAIPSVLVVAFVVAARISVKAMHASLDRRAERILGQGEHEETIALDFNLDEAEHSVEISAPIRFVGSLWDPVPVVRATYVQKPLAPRTVRTIDLSAPAPLPAVPPHAEEAVEADEHYPYPDEGDRPRAVGE